MGCRAMAAGPALDFSAARCDDKGEEENPEDLENGGAACWAWPGRPLVPFACPFTRYAFSWYIMGSLVSVGDIVYSVLSSSL